MDKTIEVVLVAVVVIATAAIMLFIFTGESGTFSNFISNSISDSNDTLNEAQDTDCSSLGSAACRTSPDCSYESQFGTCVNS